VRCVGDVVHDCRCQELNIQEVGDASEEKKKTISLGKLNAATFFFVFVFCEGVPSLLVVHVRFSSQKGKSITNTF
jgi:hypothetical protein